MLIEFRVRNFRSLRDEETFSMVASKDKTWADTHTSATGVKATPAVLRSAVIYGANASGKSNFIRALQFMSNLVKTSATGSQPGQPFNVQAFRLDESWIHDPIEFEITFLLGGVRYQYGFAITWERVVNEHLLVYKAFKPQRWFERRFDPETEKDIYEFGSGLKGPKHLWEGATRDNALFLSTAVQFNSEPLRPIRDWLVDSLLVFNESSPFSLESSARMLQRTEGRKAICDFLSAADISIADIEVVVRKEPGRVIEYNRRTGKAEVRDEDVDRHEYRFHHRTAKGEAVFGPQDESGGTRNLLVLAGHVLSALNAGRTLVIDELDTSLHTLLVRNLVQLFHHRDVNASGAQLIFTTHDTALLDAQGLFRRDQIWLVEKDRAQASSLVSLAEFSPRKNEALERGYLTGRYGGIPLLDEALGLAP